MNKQITIKDIAEELGIHHTTVSRALRNHPDVNEKTRKIILDKANKMHYVQNIFAAALRNNRSKTIGIMVPDIRPNFFSGTISYITNMAHAEGYSVMIFQSNENTEMEKQNVTALIQNRVAGLIVSLSGNTENHSLSKDMKAMNIPVVYFDRIPKDNLVDKVQIDNFQAGYDATEHLIKAGRKRIAFYAGAKKISVFAKRLDGYDEAIKKHGKKLKNKRVFYGGISFEDGYKIAGRILKMKHLPDAIICTVDQVAFGMMKAFHQKGIKIPEQVALIGFDNDPAGQMVQPSLTTMAQPIEDIAKNALEFILQRINGKNKDILPLNAKLNMKLIKRESTSLRKEKKRNL